MTIDDKGPHPLGENTQQDVDRENAMEQTTWALRDLAANLIRIVRGAGKSFDVVHQTDTLVKALVEYRDVTGAWPDAHSIANALSIDRTQKLYELSPEQSFRFEFAQDEIMRGALQIAASRLLGQRTQERVGESELRDGVRKLEEYRGAKRPLPAPGSSKRLRKPKS